MKPARGGKKGYRFAENGGRLWGRFGIDSGQGESATVGQGFDSPLLHLKQALKSDILFSHITLKGSG